MQPETARKTHPLITGDLFVNSSHDEWVYFQLRLCTYHIPVNREVRQVQCNQISKQVKHRVNASYDMSYSRVSSSSTEPWRARSHLACIGQCEMASFYWSDSPCDNSINILILIIETNITEVSGPSAPQAVATGFFFCAVVCTLIFCVEICNHFLRKHRRTLFLLPFIIVIFCGFKLFGCAKDHWILDSQI